ncbi:PREDICTED: uncharacterized protein LOC109326373 [Lupinus angustifolius]|uniref:uncharacterized protein LOC109326373 n=1 Tax=Lupinus angustifolius TaxID=3871 RepID=UPI00092EE5F0|nr:PREDICTED: uncharacterized protein LOC109326373 [Lupinus angustifolius]
MNFNTGHPGHFSAHPTGDSLIGPGPNSRHKYTHQLYAMTAQAANREAPPPRDSRHITWYPDSGATNHLTADASLVHEPVESFGHDQIYMGNDTRIPIKSVGNSSFTSNLNSNITISLHNLLLVPSITKNLLSVSQFARENSCYFEFHSNACFVKSEVTNEILLHGSLTKEGLCLSWSCSKLRVSLFSFYLYSHYWAHCPSSPCAHPLSSVPHSMSSPSSPVFENLSTSSPDLSIPLSPVPIPLGSEYSPSTPSTKDSTAPTMVPPSSHPMQTRSKSGIFQNIVPKVHLTNCELVSAKAALAEPVWQQAIQVEYDALMALGTWTLVPLPPHKQAIGFYVDDIIVTGSSPSLVKQVIKDPSCTFALKQLGPLDYFLGIEVKHQKNGSLFSSQTKYIRDLLDKANLSTSKASITPMATNCKLTKHGSDDFEDPTFYRSIVGALQYATVTRPGITYSVNKRILRYLQGTKHLGLTITSVNINSDLPLIAYCDADWASDIDDRKSNSGAYLYLGPNLVNWWSKKQQTISRFSTEAEYRSLGLTSQELMWLEYLLKKLHFSYQTPSIFLTI